MDAMDGYYEQLKDCEKQLSMKNLVYEAEYMTETYTDSPLVLYDNFVPRLKEFHMSRAVYDPVHKARKADLEIEANNYFKMMMNQYKDENQMLKDRCERLEQDMVIVHWYQEVMEGGIDTKEMKKFYEKSKK